MSDPTKYKHKIYRIKIRSSQNIDKVWINVEKNSSWPHLGSFQVNFSMGCKHPVFARIWRFSFVGQCALFAQFGVMCWCHSCLDFEILVFCFFGFQICVFPGSKISRFPDQGLGRTWAGRRTAPRHLRDISAAPPDHKVGEIQGTKTIP